MSDKAAPRPSRVRLAPGRHVQTAQCQGHHILVYPSGIAQLNESAAEILTLCDGTRTREEIIAHVAPNLTGDELAVDIREFFDVARRRGWIVES